MHRHQRRVRRAIFYLTYNGVFNNTNGIGTQTKTFLAGMLRHHDELRAEFGEFAVHLVSEIYRTDWWGYSEADLAYARGATRALDGEVHFCPYSTYTDEFWSPESWLALSTAAAATVLNEARRYDETLVIANDVPFLHAPLFIERAKRDFGVQVRSLIALYSSAYVHRYGELDEARLRWERTGLATPAQYPEVKLAHFGDFMRRHFQERYGVHDNEFAPCRSSLDLGHPDFRPMPSERVQAILAEHSIPMDRDLVLAFGRADWIKGFDILLDALADLRERVHLVLNVVPYDTDAPILAEYRRLIAKQGLRVTLLTGYSRDLPRALSQWPRTRTVVCPSRGEPLSNIPFEVSLWARDGGPVLVCSDADGYPEQVTHGANGFLFASGSAEDLAAKLVQALDLNEAGARGMRRVAYERVMQERGFLPNFRETLGAFWEKADGSA
ncbi:MAG: glycosyltransferase family 4 protein [Dehalococcoidia bacterium]